MSFREKKQVQPWRKVYEGASAAVWGGSAIANLAIAAVSNLPSAPFHVLAAVSGAWGTKRLFEAWSIWRRKLSLMGKSLEFIDARRLKKQMDNKPGYVWLGWGFDWKRTHSQSIYDFKYLDLKDFMPPKWFCALYGKFFDSATEADLGAPWIHGLEPKETELYLPIKFFDGHTLIVGVTGSGKTRMFDTLVMQAVLRGDTVIVIDPKGDKEMRERTEYACKIACELAGRADSFRFFHPAFTAQSVRIDPLKNFGNITELASRVSALIPSESGSDAFKSFAFRVLNAIAEGLVASGVSPTLKRLQKYIEGGPEGLLQSNLEQHYEAHVPDWAARADVFVTRAKNGTYKAPSPQSTNYLVGLVAFWQQEINTECPSDTIDKLVNLYQHSREHFGKMIGNLLPILDMLCSGELGKLLSPDPNDLEDEREILDSQQIIAGNGVVYLGLNSLSDSTVASAIGSIMLADLAATAGAIYNYQTVKKRVCIFVDEASEVVNDPFIQILNKGRGAGFQTTVATQTIADFYSRLGSQDKGSMVLGNFNNYIAQRVTDRVTQEFIVEKFGECYIENLSYGIGTAGKSDDNGADFSSNESASMQKALLAKIPADIMGQIPNLQFFGLLADGRLVKGRIPIIDGQ